MICKSCRARFSDARLDAVATLDGDWCSEHCARVDGVEPPIPSDVVNSRIALSMLRAFVPVVSARHVFGRPSLRQLSIALAILRDESTAARRAGPPTTLRLLRSEVAKRRRRVLGGGSAAQLNVTGSMLLRVWFAKRSKDWSATKRTR